MGGPPMNSRPVLPRPWRPPMNSRPVLPRPMEANLWTLALSCPGHRGPPMIPCPCPVTAVKAACDSSSCPSHGYRGRLWVPDLLCPRPLRPSRLSLCCLSLLSLCCPVSTLPVSSVSALSVFPQIPDSVMVPCLVHGPTPSGGLQSRLLRPGGLQSRLLRPGGSSPVCSAWWAPVPSAPPWGLQVSRLLRLGGLQVRLLHPGGSQSRLLRLGGLQVRLLHPGGSQSRLLRPGGLQVRLLRPGGLQCHPLRLGFHMDLALRPSPCSASAPPPTMDCLGASGSRSLGGGYVTNPGHELCFTPHSQSQITQGLHFPSSTAPTQLSALITHTPANNHPITITQSHTHTHTT